MKRPSNIKYILKIITFILLPLLSYGCSSVLSTMAEQIYLTVVDCRDVKTILDDTKIKLTIINKFHDDEYIHALNSLDLSIECYKGDVYLVGEYDKPVQKKRAIQIAKSIKGVKKVTSYLLPKKKNDICGIDENLAIMGNVKAKLIGDKNLRSRNIDVKSVQCNVVLYGIVASNDRIAKAIKHAKSVKGVRHVKSFLKSAAKTKENLVVRK
jgi:hyperosmotically inducible periplasmic protein